MRSFRLKKAVLDVLMQNEAENNLIISIITSSSVLYSPQWLLSTVHSEDGRLHLIAVCTLPFNLLLAMPENVTDCGSAEFLAIELCRIGYKPTGVLATETLARRFAKAYDLNSGYELYCKMNIMRLDVLKDAGTVSGKRRRLTAGD